MAAWVDFWRKLRGWVSAGPVSAPVTPKIVCGEVNIVPRVTGTVGTAERTAGTAALTARVAGTVGLETC